MGKQAEPINDDPQLEAKIKELCAVEIDKRIDELKGKWITWKRGLLTGLAVIGIVFPALYFSKEDFVKKTHNELWGSASVNDVKGIFNSGEVVSTYQAKVILKKGNKDNDQFIKDFIIFQARPDQTVKLYLRTFHSNSANKRSYFISVNNKKLQKASDETETGLWTIDLDKTHHLEIMEREENKYINTLGFELSDNEKNFLTSNDQITVTCIIFVYGKI